MAGRISQVPAEVIILPTNQKARVSQIVAESIILPTNQKARVSQIVVEVLILQEASTKRRRFAQLI
jgi:hypothetical protein